MSPILPAPDRRAWVLALALSPLWHLVLVFLVPSCGMAAPPEAGEEAAPEPLAFFFAPEPPEPEPRRFVELPEERAETAPEKADFLGNVDSRARDEQGGGEGNLPRLEGRAEFLQLPMESAGHDTDEGPAEREIPYDAEGEGASAPARTPPPRTQAQGPAREEIRQEALSNEDGSVQLLGEVSANTAAWVFGEWMKSFRRKVMRNWDAPYAFDLGMLEGWTLVEIEVDRRGRLLRCKVLEEQGHESLRISSVNALETSAPFEAFPEKVPEPTLTLRIKMIYSNYPSSPPSQGRGAR